MSSNEGNAEARAHEINLVAVLKVLWRYKFFVAGVSFLFGLLAVYLALTATEIFRAEIVVNDAHDNDTGSKLLSGSLGGLASLAGLGGLANSDISQEAQATLNSYRLPAEFIRRRGIAGQLTAGTGRDASIWQATKQFREQVLSVDQDKLTGITTIGIEWKDPTVAAQWANDYVALANELMRSRAMLEAGRNVAYLEKELAKTNVLEMRQALYDLIESQTKTLMLANGKLEYAFTVVDPAVPPELRVRPKRALMVLTGLVLGGVLGSALALVFNAWRIWREQTGATRT